MRLASSGFRFQHVGKRLGGIGERRGIDRNLTLDQPADRREVALRVDADGMRDDAAVGLDQQCRLAGKRTADALRGCACGQPTPWM